VRTLLKNGKVKNRFVHELNEFLSAFIFIAPFVLSFATFRLYVSATPGPALFVYATALVNALVLAKIVLIEEWVRMGKRSEDKALMLSTIHKSFFFTLLFLAFHILEGAVHHLWHGQTLASSLDTELVKNKSELLGTGLVIFFGSMPFFALREVRRVIGIDAFRSLFFSRRRFEGSGQFHGLPQPH
jgi:hypothetical protein